MIIRVLDQNYFVQQTIPSGKGLVQYVCTNVSENDGRIYRIVRIPVQDVKPELVKYLADIYKEGLFHQLVQYGNEKDHFHVVMDCGPSKARPLKDRLQQDVISLAERLSMGENFLEYLIVSSVPVWFAESSMDTDHVVFTDALECALVFELEHLEDFADAGERSMQAKLKNVLAELFAKELDKSKIPEMAAFLQKVSQGEYSGMLSIYQEYQKIAKALAGVDEATLEPKSFLWRMWDKIKSLARYAEKLLGFVVFIIAIAYLVWSIYGLMQPTKARDIYPAIGDEKILSGTRAAEEAETAAEQAEENAAPGTGTAAEGNTEAGK